MSNIHGPFQLKRDRAMATTDSCWTCSSHMLLTRVFMALTAGHSPCDVSSTLAMSFALLCLMLSVRGPCPWAALTVSFERTVQSFLCRVSAAAFICQTLPSEAMIENVLWLNFCAAATCLQSACRFAAVAFCHHGNLAQEAKPKGLGSCVNTS